MFPSPYLPYTLIKLPGHSRPWIRVTKVTLLSGGLVGSLKPHKACFVALVACPSETLEAHGDANSHSQFPPLVKDEDFRLLHGGPVWPQS